MGSPRSCPLSSKIHPAHGRPRRARPRPLRALRILRSAAPSSLPQVYIYIYTKCVDVIEMGYQ